MGLEMSRLESGVLGNALDGVPEEEDEANNSKVEDPAKMTEEEKKEVEEKVGEALNQNYDELEKKAEEKLAEEAAKQGKSEEEEGMEEGDDSQEDDEESQEEMDTEKDAEKKDGDKEKRHLKRCKRKLLLASQQGRGICWLTMFLPLSQSSPRLVSSCPLSSEKLPRNVQSPIITTESRYLRCLDWSLVY